MLCAAAAVWVGFGALGIGYALIMPLAMARAGASASMPQAMAVAGDTLLIAGPPDLMDEEYTFDRIMEGDLEELVEAL